MNPETEFMFMMTETQARRLLSTAIEKYINSWNKEEVVDEIISDCFLSGTSLGTIG
jgi:hypothetical protein